jgi:26S proteasome non-ATPase regulatory subunit 10
MFEASLDAPQNGVADRVPQANPKLANLVDLDGRLPIHWACTQNHLEIVRLLTNVPRFDPDVADESGWTCLHIASSLKENQGDEILDLLLSKDADVSLPTSTGATALHFATSKDNLDIAKKLVAHKASARVKDKRGQLALHRAAALGSVPLTKLLLANKSPINATDASKPLLSAMCPSWMFSLLPCVCFSGDLKDGFGGSQMWVESTP